jgi:hypothetical protein
MSARFRFEQPMIPAFPWGMSRDVQTKHLLWKRGVIPWSEFADAARAEAGLPPLPCAPNEFYRPIQPPRGRDHTCGLCEAARLRATVKDYPSSAFGFASGAIVGTGLGVCLTLAALALADWWVTR